MNIVITGASKGIGLAIAEAFAAQNISHTIGLCARSQAELAAAESSLQKNYPRSVFSSFTVDVGDEEKVNDMISHYEEKFGTIDILVNNAGFGIFAPTENLSVDDFRSVLRTNLRGVFLVTKAALPKMRVRKQGTIITISSLAGKNSFKGGAAYTAAKHGVRGLMQSLFLEVRSDNIRVVTICPGSVDTAFFDRVGVSADKRGKYLTPCDVAECVLTASELPIGATLSELDLRPTNP